MSRTSYLVVGIVAAVIAGALIVASQLGGSEGPSRPSRVDGSETAALLAGVPQGAPVLGRSEAPVTLVEFADLQCPFCAQWSQSAFPEIVRDYVRPGKVRIIFRGLAFIGPDSEEALKFAYAAGGQNKLWHAVDLLYANQGAENSGWVTDDLLADIGAAIPSFDPEQAQTERLVDAQIEAAQSYADELGVQSTPSFAVGKTGRALRLVQLDGLTADALRPTLDSLLAR